MIGSRKFAALAGLLLVIVLIFGLAFYNLSNVTTAVVADIGDVSQVGESVVLTEVNQEDNSVWFLGDIQLGRDVERRLLIEGPDYPYKKLNLWAKEDKVVVNFESSVPSVHVPTPDNTFRFSTRADFLPALRAAGVTHTSLANNHAFDHGALGYNNTLTVLANNDIKAFGHPSSLATSSITYMAVGKYRVAVIAIHTLYKYPSVDNLKSVIELATKDSDRQIAYIHWGNEYQAEPGRQVREYASVLIEAGFDAVVGHHPHVLQSIDIIDGSPVFYSLGNFIFDQYFSEDVQKGLALELMELDSKLAFKLHPVSSLKSRNQPVALEGEEKEKLLDYLSAISSELVSTSTKDGLIYMD